MSKMMPRSNRETPLARPPNRLRPTAGKTSRNPPGSLTKSQLPKRSSDVEESGLRPEYDTISRELRALAKMVHQEFGKRDDAKFGDCGVSAAQIRSPALLERGRFYDLYCARRNERLKRKKAEIEGHEKKPAHDHDLGVRAESAKKREASKMDSRRKMAAAAAAAAVVVAAATTVAERRTSMENEKPPTPMPIVNVDSKRRSKLMKNSLARKFASRLRKFKKGFMVKQITYT